MDAHRRQGDRLPAAQRAGHASPRSAPRSGCRPPRSSGGSTGWSPRGAIRGFTAQIDPDVLGWQTEAYVEIYCKGTVAPEDLQRSLERVPEVVGAATVSGDGRRAGAHARLGREAARAGAGADPRRAQRRPHPQRHRAVPADRPPAHLSAIRGQDEPRDLLRRASPNRGSTSGTASSCGCAPAVAGRRSSCCTGTRARTPPGTASPRCWSRPGTRSSAPTCAATGGRRSRRPTADHAPVLEARDGRRRASRLMRRLGHERFAVVGHDRGSYVALRLAMDHPDAVTHLAVLDCIPIVEHLERARRPVRRRLVALVLLRPAGQARAGDHRRPGRLVRRARPGQGRGDGGGEPRRPPGGDLRPGDGAGDARGLPRRAGRRPRRRGGRPRGRPPGHLPDAGAVVEPRRPRGAARRPAADLGRLDRRTCAAADRSTAGTTWPRRRPEALAARWRRSSRM